MIKTCGLIALLALPVIANASNWEIDKCQRVRVITQEDGFTTEFGLFNKGGHNPLVPYVGTVDESGDELPTGNESIYINGAPVVFKVTAVGKGKVVAIPATKEGMLAYANAMESGKLVFGKGGAPVDTSGYQEAVNTFAGCD